MIIYRVVNADGKGFYHSNNGCPPVEYWYPITRNCNSDMLTLIINNKHPIINDCIDDNFNFAFTSIDELIDWFPLSILHIMNGNIVEINIDEEHVKLYPKQCLYNYDKVISTKIIDKTQFYKHISFPTDEWWIWK